MKIGVMLRHYKQHEGGVKVYTNNLLPNLFTLDTKNRYVLMYQGHDLVGTYRHFPNVEEVALPIPGTILWDQVAAPLLARRKKVDILFNPKFTIPLFSGKKRIFVLHGSESFMIPDTFIWYDRLYCRMTLPLYCHLSDAFISVSNNVKNDIVRFADVHPAKVFPVHNGFDRKLFHRIEDEKYLEQVREKYNLPEKYIFWVGQIYPPKNIGRLLKAFAQIRDEVPHDLVLTGQPAWQSEKELRPLRDLNLENRVRFTGWVFHDDLPGIYNLADLFVLPSLYEGFGIPLVEAMASGCAVLTSKTGSPPEVVDGAARLVDPMDVDEIAKGMKEVLLDHELRKSMVEKGLHRAEAFSWEKCARQVLGVFEKVYEGIR
ncbi:MAG: glycosyltransferase family 4 protein [Desulfobacteraceae bacterium]|nr:glycosyltransferase family 4 protein [Desulfobacteraceae bacterium]